MTGKHPYEALLDQFATILKLLKENSDIPLEKLKKPENYGKFLDKLSNAVSSFNTLGSTVISLSGVSKEEMDNRLKGASDQMTPAGKRLVERTNALKKELENLKTKYELTGKSFSDGQIEAKEPAVESPPTKPLSEKEQALRRRSKFKRFGSDDKWKPL